MEGYAITEFASQVYLKDRVHQTFRRKPTLVMKVQASLEKDIKTEDYLKVTQLMQPQLCWKKAHVKSEQNHLS